MGLPAPLAVRPDRRQLRSVTGEAVLPGLLPDRLPAARRDHRRSRAPRVPSHRWRLGAATLVAAVTAVELALWYGTYDKEDSRAAERYVATHAQPGDTVGFYAPYARIPFEYYVLRDADDREQPGYPPARWGRLDLSHATFDDPQLRFVGPLLEHGPRVWIVISHGSEGGEATVRAAAAAAGRRLDSRSFTGVDVLLVARRG